MTEAAAILEVRHVRLADQVTLRPAALDNGEGEDGVFVAIDEPPPVRTVLAVVESDRRRALEVVSVVEVADHGDTLGFYGRWVDDAALARAATVGTEQFEDGTPVVQPVVSDDSAAMDVSDGMAMPAPVMIVDDDTGVVDVGDGDGDDSDGEQDEDAYGLAPVTRETASTDAATSGDDSADSADSDDSMESADSTESEDSTESDPAEASAEPEPSADSTDAPAKGRRKRGRKRR